MDFASRTIVALLVSLFVLAGGTAHAGFFDDIAKSFTPAIGALDVRVETLKKAPDPSSQPVSDSDRALLMNSLKKFEEETNRAAVLYANVSLGVVLSSIVLGITAS